MTPSQFHSKRLLAGLAASLSSIATVCTTSPAERAAARRKMAPLFAEPTSLLADVFSVEAFRRVFSRKGLAIAAAMCLMAIAMPATAMGLTVAPIMGAIRFLDSYAPMVSTDIAPTSAGRRIFIDLDNGKANRYIQLMIFANITIATANGMTVKNAGLPSAMFTEIGIREAGSDVVVADGRILASWSKYQLDATKHPDQALSSPNVGSYTAWEQLRISFENPRSVGPAETLFLEKKVNQKFQLFLTLAADATPGAGSHAGLGRIMTGNATTVATFTDGVVHVTAQQLANADMTDLPLFRYKVSPATVVNPAAINANYRIDIPVDVNEYLRGLTIMVENNTTSDLSSLVSGIALRGDTYEYIGQGQQVPLADYVHATAYESGGDLESLYARAIIQIDFQKSGRLSRIYNPTQDTNLRLYLNVTSAAAQITVVKHSLIRDLWVDASNGRRVCAPELPPELALSTAELAALRAA